MITGTNILKSPVGSLYQLMETTCSCLTWCSVLLELILQFFFQPSFLIILYVYYELNTICILKRVVLPWDPIYRYDFMCIFSFHLIFIIHHIFCWLFVVICQFLLAIKTDLGTRYNPIIRNNFFSSIRQHTINFLIDSQLLRLLTIKWNTQPSICSS